MTADAFTAPHLAYGKAKLLKERLLAGNLDVKEVYLYGSFARETATPRSDIDVLVILPLPEGTAWRIETDVRKAALEIDPRMEAVCMAPEGFDERISSLAREVKHAGIPVH